MMYKNDIVIYDDYVEIILCDRYGFEKARAIIDLDDLEKVGKYRWHESSNGYVMNSPAGLLHRFIMNAPEDKVIDHINHNPLDNRKSNLRICTQAENGKNLSISIRNSTGYKGVYFDNGTKKYRARIGIDYGKKSLGYYHTAEEAAIAYDKAAIMLYNGFGYTNFPLDNYAVMDDGRILTYDELIEDIFGAFDERFDLDAWNLFDVSDNFIDDGMYI